jgi:plastocyanin
LLGAGPAPAELTVALANYRFEPASIHLEHGRSYLLHLVNRSTRGHNFVAPALIAGKVEVPAGGRVDVAVVAPPAGRYPLKCTHFTHALRGMKGEIVVD